MSFEPIGSELNVKGIDEEMTPLISVIIPCFNSSRTLADSIDSALAQTYPRVEVIVVDDGSTDNSAEICGSYGQRIRLVRQANGGLSAARNSGIRVAQGEYLTLLDSDDLLLPECLARRAAILEQDTTIGLVAGWFREIDHEGKPIDRVPELRTPWAEQPFRQAVRRNWGPPVGWTFRRDVFFRVGGFDPLLRGNEDWDFVIRVASRYRIGYDPTPQVLYRKSQGQASSFPLFQMETSERMHRKNVAYATDRFTYWLDVRFGRFEIGRRTLYQVLFQEKRNRFNTLLKLFVQHPYMMWVLCFSGVSYLFGKRASSER